MSYWHGGRDCPASEPSRKETTLMADKKVSICKKVFIDGDGGESRSAKPGAVELQFQFTNGNTHSVKLHDHPDAILTCLGWFGISEKYGNSYAKSDGSADVAEEKFLAMQEQLVGGVWVTESEAGDRPSMVCDAICAALEANGEKVDDERRTKVREMIKDKDTLAGAKKDPAVKAQLERIKAERAIARAKEAAKAAKDVTIGQAAGF